SYQDLDSVDDSNITLLKITYGLELCGEVITDDDLLYKIYLTFDPKDLVSTHKAKKFTTYNDILSYLLANEQRKQKIQDTIRRFEKLQKRFIKQRNSEMRSLKNEKEESEPSKWHNIDCETGLY